MFCPQCGSENHSEKNYCRQCGLPLASVRLAVDGRVDEAIKTVESDKKLSGYRFSIGLGGFFILVSLATIFTAGKIGFSNIASAALILILMMIYFIYVSRKLHRVTRLLDEDDQSLPVKFADSLHHRDQFREELSAPEPRSITEQSTLKLNRDDRMRQER